ncbi:MAG: tRNA 4-thiouridine(8) synthase ThiI [Clostridia bacterium]|nr:tRNA 4-thiouridine(8) synthase ThiI [Clostridia bacterium]
MKEVMLLRFGEIFLKGKNYAFFENTLFKNIKRKLKKYSLKIEKISGRFLVSNFSNDDKDAIISDIKSIFGLVSLSLAKKIDTSFDKIKEVCENIKLSKKTFKVDTKRADKSFPMRSFELSAEMGGVILSNNASSTVDVHNPDEIINIDIRDNKKTYIFYDKINCLGGMPVNTAGKAMLLLSGGIDSPVAGFLMAKRGLSISAIHFHSYPYTSEQAKQKVIDLAHIIKKYTGDIRLFVVPFTQIQEEIHKNCDSEYMVTLVRRFMMDIAERVAKSNHCQAIITGENLGQVASQTVEGITSTNLMSKELPIFRPLISFDKVDISKISQEIGTYKISTLPYEDCCSLFLPKNPVTRPKIEKILENEKQLDRELLIKNAMDNIEIINIQC